MSEKLRVRAVEGHRVPFVDHDGRTWMGRYAGIDFVTGEACTDEVSDSAYYRKMLAQGALEEAPATTDDSESATKEG